MSTVKNAYTISVLHCGHIVEQGNLNFFITFKSVLLSSKALREDGEKKRMKRATRPSSHRTWSSPTADWDSSSATFPSHSSPTSCPDTRWRILAIRTSFRLTDTLT